MLNTKEYYRYITIGLNAALGLYALIILTFVKIWIVYEFVFIGLVALLAFLNVVFVYRKRLPLYSKNRFVEIILRYITLPFLTLLSLGFSFYVTYSLVVITADMFPRLLLASAFLSGVYFFAREKKYSRWAFWFLCVFYILFETWIFIQFNYYTSCRSVASDILECSSRSLLEVSGISEWVSKTLGWVSKIWYAMGYITRGY